jgi:hypothetical protein
MDENLNLDSITQGHDKEVIADLLSELLYLALTGNPTIRLALVDLCEDLCDVLDADTIERCKDYARYRKNEYAKTLK